MSLHILIFLYLLADIPRIPSWLRAIFSLGEAHRNEICSQPTG
jgi:hypothetical protein